MRWNALSRRTAASRSSRRWPTQKPSPSRTTPGHDPHRVTHQLGCHRAHSQPARLQLAFAADQPRPVVRLSSRARARRRSLRRPARPAATLAARACPHRNRRSPAGPRPHRRDRRRPRVSSGRVKAVEARARAAPRPRAGTPILLFFYSNASGPCRRVEGFIAQVLQRGRNRNTFTLHRIDADLRPELSERFRVKQLPTLLVIDEKRTRVRLERLRGFAEIQTALAPWLR